MSRLIEKFTNAFDSEAKNHILSRHELMSEKGKNKFNIKLSEYHCIIIHKSIEERIKMINEFLDKYIKIYPKGSDDSKNLYAESLKKKVQQIDKKTGVVVAEYDSVRDAAKSVGVNNGSICMCCQKAAGIITEKISKGGYNSAGGYKWRYEV